VCINYIERADKAGELAARIRSEGGVCITHQADVADREAVFAMVRRTERELGPVSLLVSNAGIAEQHQFQDITPEFWQRLFAVNVNGAFHSAQAVLPNMLHEHAGCMIFVSSIWGQHGASCEAAYSATKHAIIGLSRSLSAELALSGIRVNCVAPGVIDTDMVQVLGQDTLEQLAREIPLGRLGRPEEIAQTVLYLAENPYITGQVVTVDGGFLP
jgi:3-oxoacyl-[acyl-carrier protein] reductase